MRFSPEAFESLVAQLLDSLPDEIQSWLDNVAVVVAQRPTPEQLARARLASGDLPFGLYVGVPKTERRFTYGEIVPGKIVIFQRSIERACRTPAQVREQVRRSVLQDSVQYHQRSRRIARQWLPHKPHHHQPQQPGDDPVVAD